MAADRPAERSTMMMRARFDKLGKRLPETGHGCGCLLCAESNAPRYERRRWPRTGGPWSPLRRRLARIVESLRSPVRPQAA